MTTESDQTQWTVGRLLDLFDVQPDGKDRFIGQTGVAGDDERQVVEGTQVLAQAIVAVAKRFPDKSVRSVQAVFARAVVVGAPVELDVDVVAEGRSTATAIVTATQNGKRCMTVTVFADVPTGDVIRHHLPRPDVAAPADANVSEMPMIGTAAAAGRRRRRQQPRRGRPAGAVRLAALRADPHPRRPGQGAHRVLHRAPRHLDHHARPRRNRHQPVTSHRVHRADDVTVSFHEPVQWSGWLLYTHESTQVGAGMSYVRGAVHTEEGELIASFSQDALIRPLRTTDTAIAVEARL